jgi:hypothetical protein
MAECRGTFVLTFWHTGVGELHRTASCMHHASSGFEALAYLRKGDTNLRCRFPAAAIGHWIVTAWRPTSNRNVVWISKYFDRTPYNSFTADTGSPIGCACSLFWTEYAAQRQQVASRPILSRRLTQLLQLFHRAGPAKLLRRFPAAYNHCCMQASIGSSRVFSQMMSVQYEFCQNPATCPP